MKKEKKIQKIILLIKGEDKERDLNAVEFLQMIHLLKLHYIWDDYKKIKRIKNPKYEVKKIEEEFLLGTSKAGENWMRKQVYGETILFQGISFFQKVCKDWFQIGLIYSPKRLNHFKEKEIKIGAILEKENLRLGISELIIEKINFNDISEINKNFEKVFGISLFNNKKEKRKIVELMEHRHIIAHNSSLTDKKFLETLKKDSLGINQFVGVKLKDLDFLLKFINKKSSLLSHSIRKIINGSQK